MTMSSTMSPQIVARLTVTTPVSLSLDFFFYPAKHIHALWAWSIYSKNSNLFSICSILLVVYFYVSYTLQQYVFSLMCTPGSISEEFTKDRIP